MKRRNLVLAVFISQLSFGQSFYPLAIGNQWNYDSSSSNFNIKVIGDSLFTNGFHYWFLNRPDYIGSRFLRIDSQRLHYFDPGVQKDISLISLQPQQGDTTNIEGSPTISRVIAAKIDSQTWFGQRTRVVTYRIEGIGLAEILLAENFGPVKISVWYLNNDPIHPGPDVVQTVLGCIINGKHFGLTTYTKETDSYPVNFHLFQNYPNPFNPTTMIQFSIPQKSYVQLIIIDPLGRQVEQLISGVIPAGLTSRQWAPHNIQSGIYFYRLKVGEQSETKKLILLR